MEMGDSGHGVVIADSAQHMSYLLQPAQKMFFEMKGGAQGAMFTQLDPNDACKTWREMAPNQDEARDCKRVGSETVNGRSTVKYQGTSAKTGETVFAWVDPSLRSVVKVQSKKGSMELKNIKEGPQPAALFAVPADYKKLDMPGMAAPKG
jgi:hypothetical protein